MKAGHSDMEDELERLHDESFGWALSCTGWNEEDAKDVLQVSYMRVISGKAKFQGRSEFRTWLFGVIRLVALERRRKEGRRTRLATQAAEHLDLVADDDPVARIERSEETRRLIEAMEQLPVRQKEILHLVFYEGVSIAQAAEVMGVSVGSARTHYARAKVRIRTLMEVGG